MRFFTRSELKTVIVVLVLISLVTGYNLDLSIQRARDARRRADMSQISNALNSYFEDFGFFPSATSDGKILACKGEMYDKVVNEISDSDIFDIAKYESGLRPCEWGEDGLRDLGDESYPAYLTTIPQDPKVAKGYSYYYLSNNRRYQLFTYLEGKDDEIGYDEAIVKRDLPCGNQTCSYGKSYGITPLEKSIEEYENELLGPNQ